MNPKTKKILFWTIGAVEVAILIFCLVIAILTLQNPHTDIQDSAARYQACLADNGPMIAWLQNNQVPFFLLIVLPVFVIFLVDGIYLVIYAVKKPRVISKEDEEALREQARAEARAQILREMQEQAKAEEAKPEEKPVEEEPKEEE